MRYRPSPRVFNEHPPPIAYGPGDIVRKVDSGGLITFRNRPIRVGKAFRWQPVALRPTPEDGTFDVHYCTQRIGRIDLRPSPRTPVDLWTSQERCPQPHRRDISTRSKMKLEQNQESVLVVPARVSSISPVRTGAGDVGEVGVGPGSMLTPAGMSNAPRDLFSAKSAPVA